MSFWERLGKIDRKIIFLVMAVVIIIPLLSPLNLVGKVGRRTKELFQAIDKLPEGSYLLITIDFDPQSMPELYPMYLAILRHAFAKNLRVIVTGLWVTGVGLGEEGLKTIAPEYNKVYGKDYVFLGWKPGITAVILGMGRSMKETFPTDYYGTPYDSLPIFFDDITYKNIPFMVSLSAGVPGYDAWIAYAQSRFGIRIGAGVTAVSAADAYPYLQSGQLTGLLGGMKAAAEYEFLNEKAGFTKAFKPASQLMDSQSLAHLVIMILVIIGNISYFALRRRR
ncbi:MAG: hypothetical protein ABIK81_01055 [candidate division WOR-3 bacterium]